MDLNLKGKKALITGSTKGIGLQIARTLISEGCKVAINSRNNNELNEIAQLLNGAIPIKGDVTDPVSVKKIASDLINHFGEIDILVCNVGSGKSVKPGFESISEWEKMFNINFFSTTIIVEEFKELLSSSKGVIVCISSICGVETVSGAPVTYSASKAALNSYVKGISRPFARLGIRINAIAAGNILFKDSTWDHKLKCKPNEVKNMLKTEVPLNMFGEPIDVANLVSYLSSSCSRFITGTVINLDGGQLRS